SEKIMSSLVIAKQAADLHTSTIEQHAVAELLKTFDYDGHVAKLCSVYGERCRTMLEALEKYFPEGVRWTKPDGGLFVWIELPEDIDGEDLFNDALPYKVAFVPGAPFFANDVRHDFIRLNFSNQPSEMIEEGVRRIADVLKRRMRAC